LKIQKGVRKILPLDRPRKDLTVILSHSDRTSANNGNKNGLTTTSTHITTTTTHRSNEDMINKQYCHNNLQQNAGKCISAAIEGKAKI
jgi:hypothetical protein